MRVMIHASFFTLILAMFMVTGCASLPGPPVPEPGQRVVFLGDSNTYAAQFIINLDAALNHRGPGPGIEILNLGLPGFRPDGVATRARGIG